MSRASKAERRARRAVQPPARRRRYAPAYVLGDDSRLVERPAPGAAPTAFRIWQAGPNAADGGVDVFSQRSADLLQQQQQQRGNLFSIDINHRSLTDEGPAEGTRAAGWHKLEVRPDEIGKPELWAVAVEWSPDIKAGLEERPPRWRYFSPAFDVDPETNEVIRYVNTAVCINPATWNNPQLATINSSGEHKRSHMNLTKAQREALAVLNAMHARMNGDGSAETKASASAMYTAEGGAEVHEQLKALAADGPDDDEDDDAAASKKNAASDDSPPPTSKSPGSAPPAKNTTVPVVVERAQRRATPTTETPDVAHLLDVTGHLAADHEELKREVQRMRTVQRAGDVEKILASRKDLSETFKRSMRELGSPSRVRTIVDAVPRPEVKPPLPAPGTTTRGEGQGAPTTGAPTVAEQVLRAMKIPPGQRVTVPKDTGFTAPNAGARVFRTMQPRLGVGFTAALSAGKDG